MALIAQFNRLRTFIHSMHDEMEGGPLILRTCSEKNESLMIATAEAYLGVVNDQFNELQSLKNTREPDCVVQMIETYFADVDMILSELSRHVENSKMDFCKLASLAREIEDKSTSIGAEHMRLACSDLIKACDEKHKKNFTRSLPWVITEFTQTRNKLGAFVRMERRIIRFESSQSSN